MFWQRHRAHRAWCSVCHECWCGTWALCEESSEELGPPVCFCLHIAPRWSHSGSSGAWVRLCRGHSDIFHDGSAPGAIRAYSGSVFWVACCQACCFSSVHSHWKWFQTALQNHCLADNGRAPAVAEVLALHSTPGAAFSHHCPQMPGIYATGTHTPFIQPTCCMWSGLIRIMVFSTVHNHIKMDLTTSFCNTECCL